MRVRYSKYEPGFDDLTASELMDMLEDFLLDSGFSDPYNRCLLYTFRAHETRGNLVCRLLLDKKKK